MATIPSFEVPDEALAALGLTPEEFARELRLAAAAFWYDRYEISQEIGSYIAGLNRRDFILGLSRLKVDVLQESIEELKQGLEHARAARGEQLAPDRALSRGDA
ncbi:MAG: UPF0175 family protein [Dehalococcoidia bacterium]